MYVSPRTEIRRAVIPRLNGGLQPAGTNQAWRIYLGGGGVATHLPGTFTQGLLSLDPGPVPTLQLYSRISPFGHFPAMAGAANVMATTSRASVFNMACNLPISFIRRSAYADSAGRSYSNSRPFECLLGRQCCSKLRNMYTAYHERTGYAKYQGHWVKHVPQ
jgi:hypothetical protein